MIDGEGRGVVRGRVKFISRREERNMEEDIKFHEKGHIQQLLPSRSFCVECCNAIFGILIYVVFFFFTKLSCCMKGMLFVFLPRGIKVCLVSHKKINQFSDLF